MFVAHHSIFDGKSYYKNWFLKLVLPELKIFKQQMFGVLRRDFFRKIDQVLHACTTFNYFGCLMQIIISVQWFMIYYAVLITPLSDNSNMATRNGKDSEFLQLFKVNAAAKMHLQLCSTLKVQRKKKLC